MNCSTTCIDSLHLLLPLLLTNLHLLAPHRASSTGCHRARARSTERERVARMVACMLCATRSAPLGQRALAFLRGVHRRATRLNRATLRFIIVRRSIGGCVVRPPLSVLLTLIERCDLDRHRESRHCSSRMIALIGPALMPFVSTETGHRAPLRPTVPPPTAVNNPLDASIVARAVLLLLHVPPEVALAKVILLPKHGLDTPVISATPAVTVSCVIVRHDDVLV